MRKCVCVSACLLFVHAGKHINDAVSQQTCLLVVVALLQQLYCCCWCCCWLMTPGVRFFVFGGGGGGGARLCVINSIQLNSIPFYRRFDRFGFRLDFLTATIITSTALISILSPDMPAAATGLVITCAYRNESKARDATRASDDDVGWWL
jgi:hypothetical protein